MDLIVDANILIAVLIKSNVSYELIFDDSYRLFAPELIFKEFEKHKETIFKKTDKSSIEFFRLLEMLERRVILTPLEELVPYLDEADRITPDPDDVAYFALALKLQCPIWSNDKKLKEQSRIKIYSTHELFRSQSSQG